VEAKERGPATPGGGRRGRRNEIGVIGRIIGEEGKRVGVTACRV